VTDDRRAGVPRPPQAHRDDGQGSVVADILDVATQEFAQHGLMGARIERIAERTRTSKRMLYYHFGSKEGLYRAVLENAFEAARRVDQGFDPEAGTPEAALRRMVANAFEAFTRHPAFVRLLAFENLAGAQIIGELTRVAELNRRALANLRRVLERGQADGCIRNGVKPIDVYINMVGLCYYHVAHHVGYRAGGFAAADRQRIEADSFHRQRREAIIESCWRYVRADR
jgi:AcrR family transcriptional regulator